MRQSRFSQKPKQTESNPSTGDPFLCGIVLAGGEGKRLRPFVHLLRQDLLPKQYVNFIGTRSMLEHTLHRAEKLLPAERVFTVINQGHLQFAEVQRQVSKRAPDTVIVQPANRETAPGLLLPLMRIAKRYPKSAIVVLPSDQFVLQEGKFMSHVQLAYLLVRQDPSRLILLGVEPNRDETEYGYILPTKTINAGATNEISCFIEKPDLQTARDLVRRGALWNTMIMIFRSDTLLELVRKTAPTLYSLFDRFYQVIGTDVENDVLRDLYTELPPVNFSKEILEPISQNYPSQLLTVPVPGVLWSDWATEGRIMEILRTTGYLPRLNGLSRAPYSQLVAKRNPERLDDLSEPRRITRRKTVSSRPKERVARIVIRELV
jgi:mannose-1-phosphate guanylyltransferase